MVAARTGAAPSTRERIIASAAELTAEQGWSQVTMSRLADRAGVSRQTVYNEVGTRALLAEAMVLHELGQFLAEVDEGFDAHPADPIAAVTQATRRVLDLARVNPLLGAIVTATHGGETELVPLLTTRADSVITAASSVVRSRLEDYELAWPVPLDVVVDMIVRSVLSHVMQPGGTPIAVSEAVGAWVGAVLGRS